MLRDKDANIVGSLTGKESVLLAWLPGLARISHTLAMLTSLHFRSKPGDKLGAANIEFLSANETPHFEASLVTVLLCYHNPAVVVLFVFGQQFLEGGGVYCKLGTDAICPEILDDFHSGCAEDCCVKAGNKDVTLYQISIRQGTVERGETNDLLCVLSSIAQHLSQNLSEGLWYLSTQSWRSLIGPN